MASEDQVESTSGRLSYKFQRLRERLREAVANGELSGKLPGERILAKRFNVNAKTLSKALTDLAAEGLLDRSIGRGTYVKGSAPEPAKATRWLILCDPGQKQSALVEHIVREHPESEIVESLAALRPSFLNQFTAVIDLASETPESFLRDLVVRNISVVCVGREPRTYSINSVVMDRSLAMNKLARELLAAGHRRFAAVESRGSTLVSEALRRTAATYSADATVDAFFPTEISRTLADGSFTAVVCESPELADQVMATIRQLEIAIPTRLSISAIGMLTQDAPCSGHFVTVDQTVQAMNELLKDQQSRRPATLWLAGAHLNEGTIGPIEGVIEEGALPMRIAPSRSVEFGVG